MANHLPCRNFTGANAVLVVNCSVINRALACLVCLFAFSLPVVAQNAVPSPLAFYNPASMNSLDGLALMHQLPMLSLLDGQHLPLSTPMGRMGMLPVHLTSTSINSAQNVNYVTLATTDGKDSKQVQPVQADPLHYSGEIGAYYGRASGKFGGDSYGSYFEGTVGNDKVQITVGGSYDESNVRVPRWTR